LLNQQLKKWRQPSDIKFEQLGASAAGNFRATLSFFIPKLNRKVTESIVTSTKKQAQNELSLVLCRKLFKMGAMPKFQRSVWKLASAADASNQSKYKESGAFGFGIPASLKTRLHDYLTRNQCDVPALGVELPPETVLMDAEITDELSVKGGASAGIEPLAWSPPNSGCRPWPAPKRDIHPGYIDPEITRRASVLPAAAHKEQIIATVASSRVCIIQGSTGCGKTTQVPQFILDTADGYEKTIVVAQPRRLSAITVAQRVAVERGEEVGGTVGYAVRFDTRWPRQTNSICYMTTGFLLKRLHNRGLQGISHIIVDEVHERDLNNDFFLGLLKSAITAHSGLKVILMSATIDAVKFQLYMESGLGHQGSVPLMNIEGRVHPVDTFYLEDAIEMVKWMPSQKKESGKDGESFLVCDGKYSQSTRLALKAMGEHQIPLEIVGSLVKKVLSEMSDSGDAGSVLIFMPTWGMISLVTRMMQADEELASACSFIMLHSRVPKDEQMAAFQPAPAGKYKVIVATNIAESSITIDDVAVVIDSCKVKVTHYSDATGLSHNEVMWTGRMNLEQRRGRAGRTRAGCCFRLCTKKRFEAGLNDEVPPELTRAPLIDCALLIKSLNLGDLRAVLSNCLDPPAPHAVSRAVAELRFIRAVDDHENLTPLGSILARMPISPGIGLALLMGHWLFKLGDAMATICAAMSFDEPFSYDKTGGYLPWSISDKYKGRHKNSDHYLLGMVHQEYARVHDVMGEQQAFNFCRSEGLHPVIMAQVREATEQLRGILSSPALGSMPTDGEAADMFEMADEPMGTQPPRNYTAIRDWGPQDWQWGAIQLLLAVALPHLGVHQEKRICWVSEDTLGAMHKGSVNCMGKAAYIFPSPIFAFLEQTKEGGWKPPRCRQLTNLPPALVLLRPFATGSVSTSAEGTHAVVSRWINVGPAPADTMCLLLVLRTHLEDLLVRLAANIMEGGAAIDVAQQHQELLALLRELLNQNSLRYREAVSGAPAPASGASSFGGGAGSKPLVQRTPSWGSTGSSGKSWGSSTSKGKGWGGGGTGWGSGGGWGCGGKGKAWPGGGGKCGKKGSWW